MKLDRYKNHDIEVVIDKTVVTEKEEKRCRKIYRRSGRTHEI